MTSREDALAKTFACSYLSTSDIPGWLSLGRESPGRRGTAARLVVTDDTVSRGRSLTASSWRRCLALAHSGWPTIPLGAY